MRIEPVLLPTAIGVKNASGILQGNLLLKTCGSEIGSLKYLQALIRGKIRLPSPKRASSNRTTWWIRRVKPKLLSQNPRVDGLLRDKLKLRLSKWPS